MMIIAPKNMLAIILSTLSSLLLLFQPRYIVHSRFDGAAAPVNILFLLLQIHSYMRLQLPMTNLKTSDKSTTASFLGKAGADGTAAAETSATAETGLQEGSYLYMHFAQLQCSC